VASAPGISAAPFAFELPGQAAGNTTANPTWALIVIQESDNLETMANFHTTSRSTYWFNETRLRDDDVNVTRVVASEYFDKQHDRVLSMVPRVAKMGSSVFVQGELIFEANGQKVQMRNPARDGCLSHLNEFIHFDPWAARLGGLCPGNSSLVHAAPGLGENAVRVRGQIRQLEVFGMNLDCSSPCSGGGVTRSSTGPLPVRNGTIQQTSYEYVRYEGSGNISFSGTVAAIAFGGPSLDLHIDGWVRLPLAEAADPGCGSCFNPENRTVWATGELLLEDLRPVPGRSDRLQTRMSGDVQAFRLDEEYMDPASIFGSKAGFVAAGAAGVAVSWVAWKVAAALVHRLGAEDALTHPRRRRIHEYVHENPGTTFRELSRATGLSAGNLRHHLSILTRTKVLVEHTHRSTVRIFPNHGRYDDNWRSVVFLREKPLADLHAFVKEHDGCSQSDILDHFQALGWSRSTTQHRLLKLEGAGLVETRPRGRRKLYSLASARPPVHTLQVLQRGLEAQS
jgi:predicted transcriptional regulator